jgi:hypothetical protein
VDNELQQVVASTACRHLRENLFKRTWGSIGKPPL